MALACAALACAALSGCLDRQSPSAEGSDGSAPDALLSDGAAPDVLGRDASRDSDPSPDAAPPDTGSIDDATADAVGPVPDADPPDPGPGGTHFLHHGRCFEHTPRCGDDADCDPALYRGCTGGRCWIDQPCGCASDDDCAPGDLCFTNERVCGVCQPRPGRCADGACPAGEVCVDGWCRDDCPGHGDGPPLDCRGEPDIGRCAGRWAYLRALGTCVPVDDVPCNRARNAFDDRDDCLDHCRGPVACTVTLERVEANTDVRRVECAITHGPSACIALAHCLCELDSSERRAGQTREDLRRCAHWASVPRGAITLADFCGDEPISVVVDRMWGQGQGAAFFGPDTEVRVSPGCAGVISDRAMAPICEDGVQNGWETGVDCGAQGCGICPE